MISRGPGEISQPLLKAAAGRNLRSLGGWVKRTPSPPKPEILLACVAKITVTRIRRRFRFFVCQPPRRTTISRHNDRLTTVLANRGFDASQIILLQQRLRNEPARSMRLP